METVKYIIRNAIDHEPLMAFPTEHEAVEFAAILNCKSNSDKAEVVKVITTVKVEAL